MATIRKRDGKNGSSYQVQVRIKGGGVESASFKSLTKAKIWAQSVEASIRDGKHFNKMQLKNILWVTLLKGFLIILLLKTKPNSITVLNSNGGLANLENTNW